MKVKPIDKNMLVHWMPKVHTVRKGLVIKNEDCIKLKDIVQIYPTGTLNDVDYNRIISKIRTLNKSSKNYNKLKEGLPVYRIGYGPGNKINPLVPIDEENGKCTVPETSVFLRAKSAGGKDNIVIVRIPDIDNREEWQEKAKQIQELYGLPSNSAQNNADRCRFISVDDNFKVNWNAVPLVDSVVKWDKEDNSALLEKVRVEQLPLNNATALKIFATLCCQKTEEEAVDEMETFSFKGSKSMDTPKKRKKFYDKWIGDHGAEWKENRLRYLSRNRDDILYNELTCGLCYKTSSSPFALPISNKLLAELWEAQPKKGKLGMTPFHHTLLAKATVYNPLVELFSTKWSGVNRFKQLEKYIKVEHATFFDDLRKHIIRGINMLFTDPSNPNRYINRFVFVLQSEQTNIGKSVLVKKLTLGGVVPNFSSEFSFDDKECKTLMCTIPNLINEEVDSQTQYELRHLKEKISYSGGSIRMPYDRVATEMSRKATLWATVNPRDFLNSVNDRWIIHPVKTIDFKYSTVVDFIDLWRQCYAEWQANPLAGELKQEEVKANSAKAEGHLYYSPLESDLDNLLEVGKDIKPISVNDIIEKLKEGDPDGYSKKDLHNMSGQIGRALQRLFPLAKYPHGRYNGVRGTYFCLKIRHK